MRGNRTRLRGYLGSLGLVTFTTLLGWTVAHVPEAAATDNPPAQVMRVEEDWELVLNEPGEGLNAPQFHTVMSPFGHTDGGYAQVSWNYREVPEFAAGGLQLQAWTDAEEPAYRELRQDPLSLDAETISWTQVLQTNGQLLTFKIMNGQSESWGSFGGDEAHVHLPIAVANLNGYATAVSAGASWITYGTNRVDLLVIKQVRRYGVDGLISVDSTPVVVWRATQFEE